MRWDSRLRVAMQNQGVLDLVSNWTRCEFIDARAYLTQVTSVLRNKMRHQSHLTHLCHCDPAELVGHHTPHSSNQSKRLSVCCRRISTAWPTHRLSRAWLVRLVREWLQGREFQVACSMTELEDAVMTHEPPQASAVHRLTKVCSSHGSSHM